MKPVAVFILLCTASLSGCDTASPTSPDADVTGGRSEQAAMRRATETCGSPRTYDRLKALAFDEAVKIRKAESPVLEKIAAYSVVRMEDPVVKSRDDELDVTVCTGHFVLELPPGTEDVFDSDRRLEADIEYAAQKAADGSDLVYRMQGAEPIIYRLAAIDLRSSGTRSAAASRAPVTSQTQTASVEAAVPAVPSAVPRARQEQTTARPVEPSPDVRAGEPFEQEQDRAPVRPSFNCSYARSRGEKMVCSSDGLARQDRAMSSAFYAALADADSPTRAALRTSRDRFLAYRDRCDDEACVSQAYADRIDEIRDIAAGRY